jgi:hypothetical protein
MCHCALSDRLALITARLVSLLELPGTDTHLPASGSMKPSALAAAMLHRYVQWSDEHRARPADGARCHCILEDLQAAGGPTPSSCRSHRPRIMDAKRGGSMPLPLNRGQARSCRGAAATS